MKVEKVSVGLVGLGMVCESHLKAYSAHPDAEVRAVCDLDTNRSKEIEKVAPMLTGATAAR